MVLCYEEAFGRALYRTHLCVPAYVRAEKHEAGPLVCTCGLLGLGVTTCERFEDEVFLLMSSLFLAAEDAAEPTKGVRPPICDCDGLDSPHNGHPPLHLHPQTAADPAAGGHAAGDCRDTPSGLLHSNFTCGWCRMACSGGDLLVRVLGLVSTPEAPLTTHVSGASRDPLYRRWAARPFRDHPCGRNEASRPWRGCEVLGEGRHRARPTTNVISNLRSLPQPALIREVVLFSFLAALSPPVLRSLIAAVGWRPPMWV